MESDGGILSCGLLTLGERLRLYESDCGEVKTVATHEEVDPTVAEIFFLPLVFWYFENGGVAVSSAFLPLEFLGFL